MKRLVILFASGALLGLVIGLSLSQQTDPLLLSSEARALEPADQEDTQLLDDRAGNRGGFTSEEQTNISVYQQANPSVVNINTRTMEVDNFWMLQRESAGSGSGAIIDKEGHVLTNYHVVEGAQAIEATLASGKSFPASLVGRDEVHDIAVLRLDAPPEELQPISLGQSNNLRVGQRVYVLGNPFGWEGTLTTGIISSLNRDLPSRQPDQVMRSLIQTDAAMNPGNSGGPLLNSQGEMIGMCVAIATRTGQNAGVGFAIPVDRIKQIAPELILNGRVVRADIGIRTVMETNAGLVVRSLVPDGPAEKAGLRGFRKIVERRQQGPVVYETQRVDRSYADLIVAVDGERMRTGVQFRDKIWQYRPGDAVKLTIVRQGTQLDVSVTLGTN